MPKPLKKQKEIKAYAVVGLEGRPTINVTAVKGGTDYVWVWQICRTREEAEKLREEIHKDFVKGWKVLPITLKL